MSGFKTTTRGLYPSLKELASDKWSSLICSSISDKKSFKTSTTGVIIGQPLPGHSGFGYADICGAEEAESWQERAANTANGY